MSCLKIMLEDLQKYDNLGSPAYYAELFRHLKVDNYWTRQEIAKFFYNRIIDDKRVFDGCMPLLEMAKIIKINEEGYIKLQHAYKEILDSREKLLNRLLKDLLLAFAEDDDFYSIFSPSHMSYDLGSRSVNLKFYAFGLKYSNIRELLINFGFLDFHPNFPHEILIVNPGWKKFFETNFRTEIRKRRISLEELRSQQEQQNRNGEMAEKFVLEFEKQRLNNKVGIEWISPYDVAAGYDILSFHDSSSKENDRYIEVKSFIYGNPYFYWSKNEKKIAEKEKEILTVFS